MNLGANKDLIEFLENNNALLDAVFLSLYLNNESTAPSVFIRIKPRKKTLSGILELTLNEIQTFDIFLEKNNMIHAIERYKFFLNDEGFCYLSLDPYDEKNVPHSKDCSLIICKEINGYLNSK